MSRAAPRFRRVNPPLPLVGTTNGVVLYRIWGNLENQLTINTFYFAAAVPNPTASQLATLNANIRGALFNNYTACLSVDWQALKCTLDVVHRNDIIGVIDTSITGTSGGRGAGHLPTEVAIVIIRYSQVKGQHGRGRIGLPGVAAADTLNSRVNAGSLITALGGLTSAMATTASDGTNTWTPSVVQRSPVSPKLVIGFSATGRIIANLLLGTVRRRKIGRGK